MFGNGETMRFDRRVFSVVFLALALVALLTKVGNAQTNTIYGFIDWIMPTGQAQTMRLITIAGWSFGCPSGSVAFNGSQLIIVDGVARPSILISNVSRPDVQAAYAQACPALGPNAGFFIQFYAAPGEHQLDGYVSTSEGVFFIQQVSFTVD